MKQILLILPLIIFASHFSFAGVEGHGGNVVICENPQTRIKTTEILDYYHARLGTFSNPESPMENYVGESEDSIVKHFLGRLGGRQFADKVKYALNVLGPVNSWIMADLRDVDDSKEPYFLPPGCQRKNVAVRQGKREMFIDRSISKDLSSDQIGFLRLHEALYYLAVEHGLTSSERVRALIREVFMIKRDEKKIDEIVTDFGGINEIGSIYDLITHYYTLRDKSLVDVQGMPFHICFATNKASAQVSLNYDCSDMHYDIFDRKKPDAVILNCTEEPFVCRGRDTTYQPVEVSVPNDDPRTLILSATVYGKAFQNLILDRVTANSY